MQNLAKLVALRREIAANRNACINGSLLSTYANHFLVILLFAALAYVIDLIRSLKVQQLTYRKQCPDCGLS
jgi:hypothetical protein